LEQEGFRPEDAKGLNAPGLLIRNIGGPSKDSGTFSGRSLMNLDDWDLRLLYSMRG